MALSPELIDADAGKVVRRLTRRGHKAYLVGGCVRDLLLERIPKDFDVATSATPTEVKRLFRNCRVIGRRFRLAHVFFGDKIIETSTFRANPHDHKSIAKAGTEELLIRHDNVFGTETEDAQRRDFTINGLFYDLDKGKVIDHVGGLKDLENRLVRTIGEPNIRFREDPVRMLRAIKFAARLDLEIEENTYDALVRHRGELAKCATPRLLEEFYRFIRGGAAVKSIFMLQETGILDVLCPAVEDLFHPPERQSAAEPDVEECDNEDIWKATWENPEVERYTTAQSAKKHLQFAWDLLESLDSAVQDGMEVSNALILAIITYPFAFEKLSHQGVRPMDASAITQDVLKPLVQDLRVARKDSERARQIILAQRRLAPARRRRSLSLLKRDYFEEALILYELCADCLGKDPSAVEYWRNLKKRGMDSRTLPDDSRPQKRRRRRRGGRRRYSARGKTRENP